MSEFHDIIGVPYTGFAKTQEQIAAETVGKPKQKRNWRPPDGYEYGKKLSEWEPASTLLSRDEFIRAVEPMHDRIVVQLVDEPFGGVRGQQKIVLTDAKPLIGGLRKAVVLKIGPGRWIPGGWWNVLKSLPGDGKSQGNLLWREWEWFPGYRRPVSVLPGQTVLIGNWVDLELEDTCLCQEGDIRAIVNGCEYSTLQVKNLEVGKS